MAGIMQIMASLKPATSAVIPTPTVYLDAVNYLGSGTTWTATNGSNATLVNTPTFAAPAPTYFSFAPASLEEATLPALSSLNNWTIEAWFRVTSTLNGQVTAVICDQYNLSTALNFSMGTNNAPIDYKMRIGFFNGAWRNTAGFNPTLNTWYHMVGTYDGTTMKEYVNGALTSSASSLGTSSSGGIGLRVARRWDETTASTNYFPGDIGLTRVWNSALTATQVEELYNDNLARFSNSVVTSNLVGYWDPDLVASYPGTGTTINNLTATSLPGTMSNITYTDPYFTYNGTSGTVSIADNAVLEPGTGDFTLEAWVYYSTIAGSTRTFISKTNNGGGSTDWSYGLRTVSNGNTYFEVGNGTTSVTSPSFTASTGTWYQITGVWTNVASNSIELYVNGVSQGSNSHAFTSVKNSTNPLYFGSYNGGEFSQWFNGRMGIVRYYSKALSGSEVLQNYNANKSIYGL